MTDTTAENAALVRRFLTDVVARGDTDAAAAFVTEDVRATVTGSHRESLVDLAPTGESFEIAYAWFCRIEDGRIAEIRSLPDGLGLLRQLGALSERGPTETERET